MRPGAGSQTVESQSAARPAGLDPSAFGIADPVRLDRWLRRPGGGALPWPQAASLGLHGLALAAALGLLALPRLTPPPPDKAVEMLWEQPPAMASAALPEAEPTSSPPPASPPPTEAVPPSPEVMPLPQPAPPPVLTAQPVPLPQPSPPPPLLEPAPPALLESTVLLPPPPPPQQTAEAPPDLPLPPLSPPMSPPPRPQPARPPAPQPAERRQTPANSAVAVSPAPSGMSVNPAPSAEGSARVVGATSAPQTDYRPPQPSYPENARTRGETGTVRLRIKVDISGQVSQVDILETSGSRELDRATEAHYRLWRFRPAMREGQPIPGEVTTNMTWTLNGLAANRPW